MQVCRPPAGSILLCSCASSDKDRKSSGFSLGELYENNPSRLRFSGAGQKDEQNLINEAVSERWRLDLILKAELRPGSDSLY